MSQPTGLVQWAQHGIYAAADDRLVITALAGLRYGVVNPAILAPAPQPPLGITVNAGWLGVAPAGDGTMVVVGGRVSVVVEAAPGGAAARTDLIRINITDAESGAWVMSVDPASAEGGGGLTIGEVDIPAYATTSAQFTLRSRPQDFSTGGAIPGPPGPPGPPGTGFEGPPGPQGTGLTFREPVATVGALPPSGNQAGDLRIVEATGDAWVWDADATPPAWVNVGPIRGPTGPAGSAGPAGANGAAGPPGPPGEQGDPGPQGISYAAYPAETVLSDQAAWLNQGGTTWRQMSRSWPVPAGTITQGTIIRLRAFGNGRIGGTTQAQGYRWNVDPVGYPAGPGLGRLDVGGVLFDTNRDFSWYAEGEVWFDSGGSSAEYRATLKVWAGVTTGNQLPATGAQGAVSGIRCTGWGSLDATVDQRFWLEHMWHDNVGSPYIRTYASHMEVVSPSGIVRLGGDGEVPQQWIEQPGQPPPPPPQPTERNFTSTYWPFMTASYAANGNRRNVNGDMFQGQASGNPGGWGDQFAFCMFDYNRIRADLRGHNNTPARVQWCQLQLRVNHTWYNSGGDLRIGYFSRTDFPASGVWQPPNAGTLGVHAFGKPQQRSLSVNTLNAVVGGDQFTGIVVGQAGSTSLQRYCVVDGGTSAGTRPSLTINYSKLVL
jgi:hypothetical protein